MLKKEIRKIFSDKRKALTAEQSAQYSADLAKLFFEGFDPVVFKTIHIFLPILDKQEIDTAHLINGILNKSPQTRIAVPKSDFNNNTLSSYYYTIDTQLELNKWNIPEPVAAVECPHTLIDLVFIPLLAFDNRGYRVGYGKGFYDRFLAECRTDVLKVGLSFFEPVDIIEDLNEYDVAMDYCITPHKIHTFNS